MSFFGPDSPVSSILILAAIAAVIMFKQRGKSPAPKSGGFQKRNDGREEAERNLRRLKGSARTAIDKLLAEDRIIEAVRDIRAALGIGLKEAKDVVDLLREGPPPGSHLH